MDNREIAKQIIEHVGGRENIQACGALRHTPAHHHG